MLAAVIIAVTIVCFLVIFIATRSKPARFAFSDHEDHVALRIEHRLDSDDAALITMTALREAVRLKLRSDYKRLVVHLRSATVIDDGAFWLLVGGLGPLLTSDTMRVAIVCAPKTSLGKRLAESRIAECFPTDAEALGFLRSDRPARRIALDRDWLDALLTPGGRRTPMPLRRAA